MYNAAPFLAACQVIDWTHPLVLARARLLTRDTPVRTVRATFEWVQDAISHSLDAGVASNPVRASDVLVAGAALCFGKAHLLAALLRANGIASGLCYQQLRMSGPESALVLHGLVGVYLPEYGWMRIDARGGANVFIPGCDSLAFEAVQPGERDFDQVWSQPWPHLVLTLTALQDARHYGCTPTLLQAPVAAIAVPLQPVAVPA
ncbi:transglutaminase domain-containing protein [Chitinibacteraceae bacterium HSL-7]